MGSSDVPEGSTNHDAVPDILLRRRSEKPLRILFGLYVVRCIELSILLSHRSNATLRRIVNMASLYDITYTLGRGP